MAGKYLIVYRKLDSVVPRPLRAFVKKKIEDEFSKFDVNIVFSDSQPAHDLEAVFSNEIPGWPAFGESTRLTMNGSAGRGNSTIFVKAMMVKRIQTSSAACEAAFPESESSLGLLIANTAIHETGHMLGMDSGGYDDAGHSTDKSNYMWSALSMPTGNMHVGPYLEYTVKTGDTMIGIVRRFQHGNLDKCRVGSTDINYRDVWDDPENKKTGFVAHPTKSGVRGRRVNDPNFIYPGEKVALVSDNLRTLEYRHVAEGFLAPKSFTDKQIQIMKDFITQQVAANKG